MLFKKTTFNQNFISKNRQGIKSSKWALSVYLIILYISVWIGFGIGYWLIANSTNGDAFIFHSHQEVESRIAIFKKNVGNYYVPHKELEDIIDNKQYKNKTNRIFAGEKRDKNLLLISDAPIGEYWSKYYKEKLLQQGIYFFSTDPVLDQNFCESYYQEFYPLKVTFYKSKDILGNPPNNVMQISSKKDLSKVKKVNESYLIFESKFYLDAVESYNNDLKNLNVIDKDLKFSKDMHANFEFVFGNSIVFIDDSIITLQKVISGEYKFPFIDFLYFSAVTITTTGYGDILPNSSTIRWLVMFETLTGVIIAGIFVSSIFYRGLT